ncbi:glycoside hydrolase family 3 C-terminal domain-containing protein [Kiritimatiellaeota bacterium B1221]|nr:glycoside hydrolase family 3 C-terminal domain-containing protein [Kiritimatiellaeota bacterium B1221]
MRLLKPERDIPSLSLEHAFSILSGWDAWHLRPLPEWGIPSLEVADCGHGVTVCTDNPQTTTCFPTGIGMASTWNSDLLEEAGQVLGRECRSLGISMLLGPKVNLHRIPLNGRSFETFSEDPVLAGRLGAAVIRGIQSTGVGACLKAMAANNQQFDQMNINVKVDERVLRELYFLNFEIANREGEPVGIMTSYNPLHGVNCGENRWLVRQVMKQEWGFEGVVISDWRALITEATYTSGIDLEMPGPGKLLDPVSLQQAFEAGLISEEDLRDRAQRMFRVMSTLTERSATSPDPQAERDGPRHRTLARRVAEESIVLLKNEKGLLPLVPGAVKKIAVIGPNAAEARLGGGGSASVTPSYTVSPLEGIRQVYGDQTKVLYAEGCGLMGEMEVMGLENGFAEFFNAGEIAEVADDGWEISRVDFSWGWASPGGCIARGNYAVKFSGILPVAQSGKCRIALYGQEGGIRLRIGDEWLIDEWISADTQDFEGAYGTHAQTVEIDVRAGEALPVEVHYGKRAARAAVRLEWEMPGGEGPMDRAVRLASEVDVAVLCLGLSNLFEGGSVDRKDLDLPEVQRVLLRRVLEVNPRTVVVLNNGGPVVMPWEEKIPAVLEAWYPGQEGGNALARILAGEVNPSGKLPDTIPYRLEDHASYKNYPGVDGEVCYEEGLMIGYRHFDHAGIEPHYPFGFGLSYSTFSLGEPQWIGSPADGVEVQVKLTNTGEVAGAEVVQVYVADSESSVVRPPKELKAFAKVFLEAGQSEIVRLKLSPRDFSFWHAEKKEWFLEPGSFEIGVGNHSRNLKSVLISCG